MNASATPHSTRCGSRFIVPLAAAFVLASGPAVFAQTIPVPTATDETDLPQRRPVAAVIDELVRIGLGSNRSLQSAQIDVERSQAALDAARARFLPEASLIARYTRAEGGREVSLPLGAAFNPIYATLNELLVAEGKAPRFGTIEDPSFQFQREREQDSRLSLRQALFAPAIPASVRAQRAAYEASEFARIALEQRLRRDITVAYLDGLRVTGTVTILDASRALLAENLRVTEALHRSGKITRDQVLRARAEELAVEQSLLEARLGVQRQRSYLNFLLNRSLDIPLEEAELQTEIGHMVGDLDTLRSAALDRRPELDQLDRAVAAAEARRQLARAARWPTLGLGVDGGTQGERYEFGRGRNFATVSVLLNWTLFDGGALRAEERGARRVIAQTRLQREQLADQIRLEVQQALDALTTNAAALQAAQARRDAAQAAFRIAGRKRDEGVIPQVEFLDARTSLTAAELNLLAVRLELLARQAELDYVTGVPIS